MNVALLSASAGDAATVSVSSLLTSIGSVFTSAIGWVGTVASTFILPYKKSPGAPGLILLQFDFVYPADKALDVVGGSNSAVPAHDTFQHLARR